jgi:hypothetical protein
MLREDSSGDSRPSMASALHPGSALNEKGVETFLPLLQIYRP